MFMLVKQELPVPTTSGAAQGYEPAVRQPPLGFCRLLSFKCIGASV